MISYLLNSLINIIFFPIFACVLVGYPFYRMFTAKDKKKEFIWWIKSTIIFIIFVIAPLAFAFITIGWNDMLVTLAALFISVFMMRLGYKLIDGLEN